MWSLRRAFPAVRRHLQAQTAGHASSFQVARAFASDADQHIKIPIQVHGVAGKYAAALFVVAAKRQMLEPVEKELKVVVEAAKSSPTFSEFIKDPSVPPERRVKAIQECFSKSEFSDITKNFLNLLAEYGRLKEIYKTVDSYSELLIAHKGEVKATVTAALEMSDAELAELKDVLKGWLEPGQVLYLEQQVDRSIIGGFVVDIRDKHIDLSIASKIRQVEAALLTST